MNPLDQDEQEVTASLAAAKRISLDAAVMDAGASSFHQSQISFSHSELRANMFSPSLMSAFEKMYVEAS